MFSNFTDHIIAYKISNFTGTMQFKVLLMLINSVTQHNAFIPLHVQHVHCQRWKKYSDLLLK